MANRIDVTTLLDGPRHLVLHVYLKSDGASGDLDSYELADPSEYIEGDRINFSIEDVTWGFSNFSLKIYFELLTSDTLAWVLPESTDGYVDFKKYGGLKDRSSTTDGTGKVLLSTTGFDTLGDEGSLIIKLRKN